MGKWQIVHSLSPTLASSLVTCRRHWPRCRPVVGLSVCPSVRYGILTRKQIAYTIREIGVNVFPEQELAVCQFWIQKGKIKVSGRNSTSDGV